MPTTTIDGFESWSGGLPVGWEMPFGVVAQSTSNVTEGTYSAYLGPSAGNTTLRQFPFVFASAGRYAIDVYLGPGVANATITHTNASLSTFTSTPGASTLYIEVDSDGDGSFQISTSGGSDVYIDNLRLIADDIFEPSTKEFTLEYLNTQIFVDQIFQISSSKEYSLTPENLSFLGDQNLIISAPKEFVLDYGKIYSSSSDWLAADWLAADWETNGVPTLGVRFFQDEAAAVVSPKDFDLVFNTSVAFADTVLPSGTKEFDLGFETLAFFGDQIFVVAAPKAYDLALTPDLDFYTGQRFDVVTTDFTLEPQDVEFYFELYRSFPVINSSEFKYELLGVSVETEEGAGRFTVFTGNDILVADVPYTTTSTNTALSGIIERGANLKVLVYMQNAYFRSFKADFAMKRIYE